MSRRDRQRKKYRPPPTPRRVRPFNEGGWIGAFVGLVVGTLAVPLLAHYGGPVGRIILFAIALGFLGFALAPLPFPVLGGKHADAMPTRLRIVRILGAVVGAIGGGVIGGMVPELDASFWTQASVAGTFGGGVLGYLVGSVLPRRSR